MLLFLPLLYFNKSQLLVKIFKNMEQNENNILDIEPFSGDLSDVTVLLVLKIKFVQNIVING